jgi:hypothetical protein
VGFMKPPKMPSAPPPAPPAPDLADQVLRNAADQERKRQRAGQRPTFLTGVLGDTSQSSTAVKKMIGS